MQPTEQYNVSRRALDVEDYIDILRRHKGWIFGPFLFTLVVSVVGGYLWPDTYVSKGSVKVEPQQVPESLVQSNMTKDMLDYINSITQSVESVSKLTEIIKSNNLYAKEQLRAPFQDVIEEMKSKIHIEIAGQNTNRQVPAFSVSFSYPDRHQAQKVVADLMSRFINESVHTQSNTTFQSAEFMTSLAENAQKELDAIEDRLAAYKMQNNGRLPEQAANNYAKLTSLETTAQSLRNQINSNQTNKIILENQLTLYTKQTNELTQAKTDPVIAAAAAPQMQKSARLQRAEADVEGWKNQLRQLQQRFRDTYPDVITARNEIANYEKIRDEIAAEDKAEFEAKVAAQKDATTGKSPTSGVTLASLKEAQDREANIQRLQTSISAYDNQIEQANADMRNVNVQIKMLQGQLDSVPQSEKEYNDLKRDRDIKMTEYQKIKTNLATAQVQKELETKGEGQNLQILDGASLPETPSYPNHPMVIAVGAGIGLMLGVVIAGAREMKDTSLKNLKDVRAYTQMAILGSIPLLENDFVVRRRRRLAWLGWTTACLASVVLMAGSVVYYVSTKGQ